MLFQLGDAIGSRVLGARVDDAVGRGEQRAAAGVLHHWTTDLLSLYSPALTLWSTESYAIAPQSAAYCSSNAASALDLCAQTAKQRPIASPRLCAGPAAPA